MGRGGDVEKEVGMTNASVGVERETQHQQPKS